MSETKRLQVKLTTSFSEKEKAVEAVMRVNQHFGLEPLAAFKGSGTGITLTFAGSTGDRIVHAFVELLPKAVVDLWGVDRTNYNHCYGKQLSSGSASYALTQKKDVDKVLRALSAPPELRKSLREATITTWEEFVDSSDDAWVAPAEKEETTTRRRKKTSNMTAEWATEIEGLSLSVYLHAAASGDRDGFRHDQSRIVFTFTLNYDLTERRVAALELFSKAGFEVFEGEIEG